ncbi:MAG: hypothetical protein AAF253_04235 [Pseudomonadota bacterium]
MTEKEDSELIALVAAEQRGMRGILVAGFSALFLVVAMSAALGAYYYFVAQTLAEDSERLERRAFETRILASDLSNRIAGQEASIRRNYAEMLSITQVGDQSVSIDSGLEASIDFLERGVRSLASEQRLEQSIEAADPTGTTATASQTALFNGVLLLMEWERGGDEIPRGATGLPQTLREAQDAFTSVQSAPGLAGIAKTGLAWIAFENASSPRSNYALEDCDALFAATDAIGALETLGPQQLYWRGQCARKQGLVEEALRNYSLAVQRSEAVSTDDAGGSAARREALLTLEMNAFHGLGTVLIAADAGGYQSVNSAHDLARDACPTGEITYGSDRTRLMHACLQRAIDLRRQLQQTENQVSGSGENISFAYLLDDDFSGAFANAEAVERTGLFAWNELVRAFVAREIGVAGAAEDARRNVALFQADEFNMCEIRKLLKPPHYELAAALLQSEHPDFTPNCT